LNYITLLYLQIVSLNYITILYLQIVNLNYITFFILTNSKFEFYNALSLQIWIISRLCLLQIVNLNYITFLSLQIVCWLWLVLLHSEWFFISRGGKNHNCKENQLYLEVIKLFCGVTQNFQVTNMNIFAPKLSIRKMVKIFRNDSSWFFIWEALHYLLIN